MIAATGNAARATATTQSGGSWRGLTWVAWRQQRATVAAALGLLGGCALVLLLSGLAIHHTAARLGPTWWIQTRQAGYYSWVTQLPLVLQAMPILIGAFVGAPLLARETELGTVRFAWTQSVGRTRLLVARLVPTALVVTAAAAGLGLLFAWWYRPLTDAGMVRSSDSSVDLFAPSAAGWVLFGVVFGVLAGAVFRRTVTAMGATAVGYLVLAYVTSRYLRQHFLTPLSGPFAKAGLTSTVLNSFFAWPSGRPLSYADATKAVASARWYALHHIVNWAIYQPASRFWPFQWIEFICLVGLSAVLVTTTIVIIHRRAS
jgi:hypothetical protein